MEHPFTNTLVHETSPYLKQHAHNPVNWHPWGEEAIQMAARENKLIIVSIGYSSCHWCHVMEKECFEDKEVARLMNDHFVSIKVDREERPDIDNLYMTALHLIDQQGGWPLNCITLPDGRPVWGGTYFPRKQWMSILGQVHSYYQEHPEATEQVAASLADGIRRNSLFEAETYPGGLDEIDIHQAVQEWSRKFDRQNGGMLGAPKFPVPVNLEFLLHYGYMNGHREVLGFIDTTLTRMARGGICDQAGGGFARYSVDSIWKVPHFEKMLYDNAQLLGLYSQAYQVFRRETYRQVVIQTIGFLEREMLSREGLYYCALDADSEGQEGKFYLWTKEELQELLKGDFELFASYYNINATGLWEHDRYILYRTSDPEDFSREHRLDLSWFNGRIDHWNTILREARGKRIRPGLDDKSLTSWNALMISGLVRAYRATGEPRCLDLALQCAGAVRDRMRDGNTTLYHSYHGGRPSIPGFHLDYALYIEACLDLGEVVAEQHWLEMAVSLTQTVFVKFFDPTSGMFHFNAADSGVLITHHFEILDNVIPSSNSVMAHNLFRLGHLFGEREYLELSLSMLGKMAPRFCRHPDGFAGWGRLLMKQQHPFYEVAVVGADAFSILKKLSGEYLPHVVLAGSVSESGLPLFRDRYRKDATLIYVCRDGACRLPLKEPEEARAHFRPEGSLQL
jgi:uncharacterized protein YyaL (SSP411 family)